MPSDSVRAQYELRLGAGFATLDRIYTVLEESGFAQEHMEILRAEGTVHLHLVVRGHGLRLSALDEALRALPGVSLGAGLRTCPSCRMQGVADALAG